MEKTKDGNHLLHCTYVHVIAKKSFLEGKALFVSFHHVMLFVTLNYYPELRQRNLGHFPFVRTDRPDHSCRNENFTFNMPSSKISQILNSMHEGDGFYYKILEEAYFIVFH